MIVCGFLLTLKRGSLRSAELSELQLRLDAAFLSLFRKAQSQRAE